LLPIAVRYFFRLSFFCTGDRLCHAAIHLKIPFRTRKVPFGRSEILPNGWHILVIYLKLILNLWREQQLEDEVLVFRSMAQLAFTGSARLARMKQKLAQAN
jgi:hypothetical protein